MNSSLTRIFLRNCSEDKEYVFREYRLPDCVLTKFSSEDWRRIVSWINSEEELLSLMDELPYSLAALTYCEKKTGNPLCFLLLFRDHPKEKDTISFHGGGWCGPFLNFRCGRKLLHGLKQCGFKVRTCVDTENIVAQRFVEALGLRKVTRRDSTLWYYFPEQVE